jgi:putative ABC transport system permease protein
MSTNWRALPYPEIMPSVARDLRLAIRNLSRSPGFAAIAIFTLAVGIGANTAIFSVANALLLRPLPYGHPDRLVLLDLQRKESDTGASPLSWPRFRQISAGQRSFKNLAAVTNENFTLTGPGDPEQLAAARVTWNFFDTLGVRMAAGRSFRPEEDRPGGDNVVVVPMGRWQVGDHLTLDSRDYTVIGVLPRGFQFGLLDAGVELYAPRVFELNIVTPAQVESGVGFLDFVARLRDGVTLGRAQAEMNTLSAQYRRDYPKAPDSGSDTTIAMGNLQDQMVSGVRTAVLVLFGAVGLVLLIACANVSSLLLSRALGRQREMAVRLAIGAPRGALVRQLLTESLVLSLAAGAIGIALSAWATRALAALAQDSLPLASQIRADSPVLAFTLAVSLLAGVLFGLTPALHVSRPDLNSVLRSEGRGATSSRARNWFRHLLVAAQAALSMILLIGAGLLLRNFIQLRNASPGFDPRHLLTMNVTLPPARYSTGPQMIAFFRELVSRVSSLPGVESAAISSTLPLNTVRVSPALPEGQPAVPLTERPFFNIQTLSPGYIAAMHVPLVAGREFNQHDEQPPRVLVVNQALARRYWPNQNPVGKRIVVGRATEGSEVVGVIGDIHNTALATDLRPEIYIPFAQLPWASMYLLLRTAGDPRVYAAAVRQSVLAIDKDQPVTRVRTMDEVLAEGARQPRFVTTLLAGLAAIALVLALVGIYGAVGYSVSQRTQEIGIRLALGAERRDILRLVLRQGLAPTCVGIAAGVVASLALTRLMAKMLYHVSPTDSATFTAGALLFAAAAVLASYLPARRATRVDPIVALREPS